jgi:hypothetical protein
VQWKAQRQTICPCFQTLRSSIVGCKTEQTMYFPYIKASAGQCCCYGSRSHCGFVCTVLVHMQTTEYFRFIRRISSSLLHPTEMRCYLPENSFADMDALITKNSAGWLLAAAYPSRPNHSTGKKRFFYLPNNLTSRTETYFLDVTNSMSCTSCSCILSKYTIALLQSISGGGFVL